MNAILALAALIAIFGICSATYDNGDGKPVCIAGNVLISKFRNNWDASRYWLCSTLNAEPEDIWCGEDLAFLDAEKECVPWDDWEWTEPYDPPTECHELTPTYDRGDGKPICIAINVITAKFRHNWDASRYWLCSTIDAEPEDIWCGENLAFLDAKKECIPWDEWEWTEPYDPPTEFVECKEPEESQEPQEPEEPEEPEEPQETTPVYESGNGKPICTATNVETAKFRNNWDATRYWVCLAVNAEAQDVMCGDDTAFLDAKKECVPWSEYVWTPPYDPPTESPEPQEPEDDFCAVLRSRRSYSALSN